MLANSGIRTKMRARPDGGRKNGCSGDTTTGRSGSAGRSSMRSVAGNAQRTQSSAPSKAVPVPVRAAGAALAESPGPSPTCVERSHSSSAERRRRNLNVPSPCSASSPGTSDTGPQITELKANLSS